MNIYMPLTKFKEAGILGILSANDDARLLQLLEDVSRQVDRYTRRHFFSIIATRYFQGVKSRRTMFREEVYADGQRLPWWFGVGVGASNKVILPDDLISVETLKEDTNADGTYPTSWLAKDYILVPYDADPTGLVDVAKPYTWIEVNERSDGDFYTFLYTQKAYQLVGKWGYWEQTEDTLAKLKAAITDSALTFTADTASTLLSVGDTILIDSEQMFITDISTDTLTVTVKRGVNGTTAATHLIDASICRYIYPGAIVEGVLMQSARLWARRTSSYAVGFVDTTQITSPEGLDKDVKEMIDPFRKRSPGMRLRVL